MTNATIQDQVDELYKTVDGLYKTMEAMQEVLDETTVSLNSVRLQSINSQLEATAIINALAEHMDDKKFNEVLQTQLSYAREDFKALIENDIDEPNKELLKVKSVEISGASS